MKNSVGTLSLVLLLMLPFCAQAQNDVLKLKGGAKFEGRIVGETEKTVIVQFPGGTIEIKRDRIVEIQRGRTESGPDAADAAPLLAGLTRFRDCDEFFFLYQSGRRVGWRTLETRREVRGGVAGYVRRDRLVFTPPSGGKADVDLNLVEFVDAELKVVELQQRMSAGTTMRLVEGMREGDQLKLVDRTGGRTMERLTLCRGGVELPGFLLRRLAVSPVPEGGYPAFQIFDPRELDFVEVGLSRTMERVNLHGQVMDVLVFRRKIGGTMLETWFDLAGRTVREEIGSRNLIAISTDQKRLEAFAAGDPNAGADDLGLTVSCDEAGLRLDRPDLSWEAQPGVPEKNLVTSLVKASSRATVEVFEVKPGNGTVSEESAAYEVLGRLQKSCDGFVLEGPSPQTIGQTEGLRFTIDCKRRDSRLKTLGFIIPRERRIFVVLCAAPVEKYADVHASFLRILQSLRVEHGPSENAGDPHASAQSDVQGQQGM